MATGIIFINAGLEEQLTNISTPEEWHKALLLPDNYKVIGAKRTFFSTFIDDTAIVVESNTIPEHSSGLTMVTPFYRSVLDDTETGKHHAELDRIEFEAPFPSMASETADVDLLTAKLRDLGIKTKETLKGSIDVSSE